MPFSTSEPRLPRKSRLLPLLAVAVLGSAGIASSATAAPQASFEIEAQGTPLLTSSAFGAQSYRLTNDGSDPIVAFEIDLAAGPAMFPDLVFDPFAGAGNEVGKPFTVDSAPGSLTTNATYSGGSDARGYTGLTVSISPGLTQGEELKFSIDIDPSVVRDAIPGPNGKISGAEHHGATVKITYATGNGTVTQTNDLRKDIGSDIKGAAKFPASRPVAPTLKAAGVSSPSVVSDPSQTLTVGGPAGASGFILVAEGHLFLGDVAGFDVDPFEANVLVGYSEYPFTIGADGTAQIPVTLSRRLLSSVPGATAGQESKETGVNYITAWFTGADDTSSPVSAPLVLEWDGSPSGGPLGEANCLRVATPTPRTGSGGTIKLSVSQLETNQRIGQAAIRRLNAIQRWLDGGIVGSDLCGGTLGPREMGGGLTQAAGSPPAASLTSPRPLRVARPGGSGKIALSPKQLRINQRIYRAALLRGRALEQRLSGRLTGGDLVDGTLEGGRFAVPLTSAASTAAAPAASVTAPVALKNKGTRIVLSAGQLRTNQKIAQRAVRQANALRSRVDRGLLGTNFAAKSVTSADLSR